MKTWEVDLGIPELCGHSPSSLGTPANFGEQNVHASAKATVRSLFHAGHAQDRPGTDRSGSKDHGPHSNGGLHVEGSAQCQMLKMTGMRQPAFKDPHVDHVQSH